jgi:hypothetical protein
MRGLAFVVAGVLSGFLAACGGGGPDTAEAPPTPVSVEITSTGALLTQAGQTRALRARVLDGNGREIAAAVSWESTRPENIRVSAAGDLLAVGSGGASQITARVGNLRSAPLLAVYTEVPAGAMLLTDTQIVGEPEETDPAAAPSLANTYRVRLAGGPVPQLGALLLNTGSKIVGGRVQSVLTVDGEHLVTLVRVAAKDMFPNLQLDEVFDLRQAEVVIPPALQNSYTVRRDGERYVFEPIPGRVGLAGAGTRGAAAPGDRLQPQAVSVEFKKGPFDCKPALDGAAGAGSEVIALTAAPSFSVTLSPSLDVKYTRANGLERFVLRAQPGFTADAGLQALVAFEGKVTCEVELLSIRLPVGGPVALVIGGQLPVGMGVELGGKLTAANIGVSAKASVSTGLGLGLECPIGSSCGIVGTTEPLKTAFTPSVDAPGVEDLRLEPSLSVYGFVKTSIGNPFLKSLRFDAFKAKVGLAMKGNFAPKFTQMADPAYQSDYKLVGEIKVGADTNFIDLAAFLGLNNVAENALELSTDIATTPVGTVTANRPQAIFGETVEFTVKLDPSKTDFFPLVGPYNVKRVMIVRHRHVLDASVVASVDALPGQTEFRLRYTPASGLDNAPADQFYAFVVTALLPTDLFALELGQAKGVAPLVLTGNLPSARVGTAYGATLESNQPEGSVVWRIATGALPPGLTLNPATGSLSGTPSQQGLFGFTVEVAAGALTAQKALEIQVNDASAVVFENASGRVHVQDFQRSVDATCDVTLRIERLGQTIREISQVGSLTACTAAVPSGSRPSYFGANNLVLGAGGGFGRVVPNGAVDNGSFLSYQGRFSGGQLQMEYRFYAGTFDTINTLFELSTFNVTVGAGAP